MIKYASMIVLDELDNVVTVLKNRPAWQAGKYNFPVGHVEEGEDFITAAVRELKEESNISVDPDDVLFTGEISDGEYFILHVFSIKVSNETIKTQMETMTDEDIVLMSTDTFFASETVNHTKELLNAAIKGFDVKNSF